MAFQQCNPLSVPQGYSNESFAGADESVSFPEPKALAQTSEVAGRFTAQEEEKMERGFFIDSLRIICRRRYCEGFSFLHKYLNFSFIFIIPFYSVISPFCPLMFRLGWTHSELNAPFTSRLLKLNMRTMKDTFKSFVELLISVALDEDVMTALERANGL